MLSGACCTTTTHLPTPDAGAPTALVLVGDADGHCHGDEHSSWATPIQSEVDAPFLHAESVTSTAPPHTTEFPSQPQPMMRLRWPAPHGPAEQARRVVRQPAECRSLRIAVDQEAGLQNRVAKFSAENSGPQKGHWDGLGD